MVMVMQTKHWNMWSELDWAACMYTSRPDIGIPTIGIPTMQLRGHLNFIMGISTLIKWNFYIEMVPCLCCPILWSRWKNQQMYPKFTFMLNIYNCFSRLVDQEKPGTFKMQKKKESLDSEELNMYQFLTLSKICFPLSSPHCCLVLIWCNRCSTIKLSLVINKCFPKEQYFYGKIKINDPTNSCLIFDQLILRTEMFIINSVYRHRC